MKPKLSELDNVVIDCGDNATLRKVVDRLFIYPTRTQGKYGIFGHDDTLEIINGNWITSKAGITPTHHINDIEL